MITPPPTWTRHTGANLVTCSPPSGRGGVRFHERLPLRRFRDLVAAVLDEEPRFTVRSAGELERLVTAEGELAAWRSFTGEDVDGMARRIVGAVFLDDFAAVLDARAPGDDSVVEPAARALLVHASFGLGFRRRRYLHRTPAGWLGVPGGLLTTWYPPAFPRRRVAIMVHPAEPDAGTPAAAFAAILEDEVRRGFVLAADVASLQVTSRPGLAARGYRYRGRWPHAAAPAVAVVVVLTDGRYRYVLRLDAADRAREETAVLLALAATIEPLPRVAPAFDPEGLALLAAPWCE